MTVAVAERHDPPVIHEHIETQNVLMFGNSTLQLGDGEVRHHTFDSHGLILAFFQLSLWSDRSFVDPRSVSGLSTKIVKSKTQNGVGFGPLARGVVRYPAVWSAMLAARTHGVGASLTSVLGFFHPQETLDILGVPEDEGWIMACCVSFGYPTGRWDVAARRPVHEVSYRNRWGAPTGFDVPEPLWPSTPG